MKKAPIASWQTCSQAHWQQTVQTIRGLLAKHFPRQKRGPRKEWISAKTWDLLTTKCAYRKVVRECARKIVRERLAIVFVEWRGACFHTSQECLALVLLPPTGETCLTYAHALALLDRSHAVRKSSIRNDQVQHINEISSQAARAAAGNDAQTLYKCVRKLQGEKATPPSGILLEDGSPAVDPLQVRKRWQRHFAVAMAGQICEQSSFVTEYVSKPTDLCPRCFSRSLSESSFGRREV